MHFKIFIFTSFTVFAFLGPFLPGVSPILITQVLANDSSQLHDFADEELLAKISPLLSAEASLVDKVAIIKLINSPLRPSIQQIIDSYSALKKILPPTILLSGTNTRLPTSQISIPQWLTIMLQHAPRIINALENTFPGGTYAFIGRDSQAWADLLEFFYFSLNQNDRIRRIALSRAALDAKMNDDFYFDSLSPKTKFLLERIINDQGIEFLPDGKVSSPHPFVLVDTVSTFFGQQGRSLLTAMYRKYSNLGFEPEQLLDQINMVGLISSTFRFIPNSYVKAQDILQKQKERFKKYSQPPYKVHNAHFSIITIDQTLDYENEAGYEHHTGAWHGTYTALDFNPTTQKVDSFFAARSNNIQEKLAILWLQKSLYEKIFDASFFKAVQKHSNLLGFNFPLQRVKSQRDFDQLKIDYLKQKIKVVETKPNLELKPTWQTLRNQLLTSAKQGNWLLYKLGVQINPIIRLAQVLKNTAELDSADSETKIFLSRTLIEALTILQKRKFFKVAEQASDAMNATFQYFVIEPVTLLGLTELIRSNPHIYHWLLKSNYQDGISSYKDEAPYFQKQLLRKALLLLDEQNNCESVFNPLNPKVEIEGANNK